MKNIKNITFVSLVFAILLFNSCSDSDSIQASQIDTSTPVLSELDIWLRDNMVAPYNIEVSYLWGASNTDIARFLYPMQEDRVKRWTETIIKVWIEPFNQLGGSDFIAKIAPRQMVYSGGFNFNPNSPTITLGIAEAGTRITFFNLDFLEYSEEALDEPFRGLRQPLQTLHHEYGHILNQTIPFSDDFGLITPGNYTAQWFNVSDQEALDTGFITPYASSQPGEDFVEILAQMLTMSKDEFDAKVETASPTGQAFIREKQQIVLDYFEENFGIDLFELQELTNQALLDSLD